LEQLAKIEAKRQEALNQLNIKYASADKVKTSFSYIGITFWCVIWSCIILNDLVKLLIVCYDETKDLLKERQKRIENEKNEKAHIKQTAIELEEDEFFHQDLEEKLEKIHLKLIEACAARRT
jgi:hypothetical protein